MGKHQRASGKPQRSVNHNAQADTNARLRLRDIVTAQRERGRPTGDSFGLSIHMTEENLTQTGQSFGLTSGEVRTTREGETRTGKQ
jgi:hypothetical protein